MSPKTIICSFLLLKISQLNYYLNWVMKVLSGGLYTSIIVVVVWLVIIFMSHDSKRLFSERLKFVYLKNFMFNNKKIIHNKFLF